MYFGAAAIVAVIALGRAVAVVAVVVVVKVAAAVAAAITVVVAVVAAVVAVAVITVIPKLLLITILYEYVRRRRALIQFQLLKHSYQMLAGLQQYQYICRMCLARSALDINYILNTCYVHHTQTRPPVIGVLP